MKKIAYLILIFLLLLLNTPKCLATTDDKPVEIVGETGILIDAKTGAILYEKNAHKPMEPASTTKIMTAILALEKGNLTDIVITGKEPPLCDGTRIYIEEGEELTLEQMLYAMLLNSANDAAIAIAEHIAGDVPSFSKMMNEKAKKLGAKNTNFVNPNGLSEEGHLTTAYDLSLMARYAMENLPDFRKIVSTKSLTIPWKGQEWDRQLYNLNKLLWNYEGADGVKTGYTSTAGRTLVASATKNGRRLIAVVLKSNDLWNDASKLLDYGFENFQNVSLINKHKNITNTKIKYGDDVDLITSEDLYVTVPVDSPKIYSKIILNPKPTAPIEKGTVLGKLEFYQDKKNIGSINLIAAKDVKRKIHTHWWFWPLSAFVFLYLPFRINIAIRRYKKQKSRMQYVEYLKKYH